MPEDLDMGALFLDQVVSGPEGELTLLFLLLYCDTPWTPSPLAPRPTHWTDLPCPQGEGRAALMTFD